MKLWKVYPTVVPLVATINIDGNTNQKWPSILADSEVSTTVRGEDIGMQGDFSNKIHTSAAIV